MNGVSETPWNSGRFLNPGGLRFDYFFTNLGVVGTDSELLGVGTRKANYGFRGEVMPAKTKKHDLVQVLNPRTKRYIKIDRSVGEVIAHKKGPGPYKNIPIKEFSK